MFLKQAQEIKKSNGVESDMCLHRNQFGNFNDNNDLSNIDTISRFCSSLCTREICIRAQALDSMESSINQWIEGCGGPINNQISNGNITNGSNSKTDYLSVLIVHIPALLRLSVYCPFSDVRDRCKHILQLLNDRCGLPVPFNKTCNGPSQFIPVSELPSVGSTDGQSHMLFIEAFLSQNSRLDHVTQVMGYHPKYLDIFLRTQNFILRGDGPLPFDYRHFIAIMAAGRHQCSYLIQLQKQEFILQGGDQTWLKGLSKIPQKLRNLYEINKILAHRPWLLNKSHIEKLTKGADSWSLAEVVHAIVLLTHFHSLSSFVFGCGVNEELDQRNERDTVIASKPGSPPKTTDRLPDSWSEGDNSVGVETLMQRMKSLSERTEEFSAEEKAKRFEHVESQSAELLTSSSIRVQPSIGHFIEDADFVYEDFARRGESSDIPTFRVHDYSWDDHGYSLVNRLYNDVGNLLDEKFKTAYNLTYFTMGGRMNVDTSRFRRAIWNYIQCMFGIRHDDYDYGEVNQLLERSLKAFIKAACCFPERVTKSDYDRVLREFKHSEKVHVNLMILEARTQAELLYALRAVMRYMT